LRVLFLSSEFPLPANKGDRIYTSNLLRQLIFNGHYVHLVVFNRGREVNQETAGAGSTPIFDSSLASRITTVPFTAKSYFRAFFSFYPGMIANRFSRKYMKTMRSILKDEGPFDAILVNHFKMAYLITAIKPHAAGARTVMITHNAEALLTRTLCRHYMNPVKKGAYYLDWRKVNWYEPRYLKQYDGVTAICQGDYEYFTREYGLRNVQIVTPGIDLSYEQVDLPDPEKNGGVILCGAFVWEPKRLNLLCFLNCKRFRRLQDNGIKFYVVGQADPRFVNHVNRAYPGVTMTGSVPDVRDYYRRCSIALIPELMGGGFKLKLLEAAAMKNAVVSLKGVITAPGFEAGAHYLEAEDFDGLIETTLQLIKQPGEMKRLAQNAYDLIEREYTWKNSYCKLMSVIEPGFTQQKTIDSLQSQTRFSQDM